MRILYALHFHPSLRKGFEDYFGRDLKDEMIDMTKISIRTMLKFYDDIHLYLDVDSVEYFKDLPVTIHILKTLPEFFCGAKLEVLKDQKDLDFIWVGPDVFISSKFEIDNTVSLMVDNMTYLNDYYYHRNARFNRRFPKYEMVREWLNSGILWFGNKDAFDEHISLYEELLKITDKAVVVETWNISYIGNKYGYKTFRNTKSEYLHFEGYKKFYDITKNMIKGLDLYL